MDLWHPRAQRVIPTDGHTGLTIFDGVRPKIVLHTTETDAYSPDRSSYYGNPYWPHATIARGIIWQHLPINVGGYALYSDGTVATNHANAIQCEIVWRAANPDWPDDLLDTVADWVSWVQSQTGVPTVFAEMWRPGVVVASVDSPLRFSDQEWLDFNGICGHSNVPGGNDHWDPGRLPVDRLKALLAPPTPTPTPLKEDDMLRFIYGGQDWVFPGPGRGDVFPTSTMGQLAALDKAGVPAIGEVDKSAKDMFSALGRAKV